MPDRIVFIDMVKREEEERKRLAARKDVLEERKRKRGRLEDELQAELTEINEKLSAKNAKIVWDPLFRAVSKNLSITGRPVRDHDGGKFPSQVPTPPGPLTDSEQALAAAYGILQLDNHLNPGARFKPNGRGTPTEVIVVLDLHRRFADDLALAHGEYNGDQALFDNVLPILVEEGDKRARSRGDAVDSEEWAAVVRTLRDRGVAADDIHLAAEVRSALTGRGGIDDGVPPSTIDIDLPVLEDFADVEIVADNLKAMQALYFSAMLEDLRLFQVVDKLVDLFQQGQLPLGKGKAGDSLYVYWRKAVDRLSEVERRNLYGRAFGFPGGEPTLGTPNREFHDLWLRFVSAVSSFQRQLTVDDLLRSSIPVTVSVEQVRKSGRDLAANLSLHGYGVAYFAATELQSQIKDAITLLSDPEIRNAYGARDMWQVIDQVATLELGGARNSVRYRTMATAGAIIIRWLADRSDLLASSSRAPLIDPDVLREGAPVRPIGTKPTTNPNDRDLVDACEQWLAVTGTPDARVEEYSQPSEAPMLTSRPIQIPSVARDLLESVGVSGNGLMGS
jgi:hypothetical protein